MAYRVIRISLDAANLMLATGSLCWPPENAPEDLCIVDARVTGIGPVALLEFLCISASFSPDPGRATRPVTCGGARGDDWDAPAFVLEGTHAGRRETLCSV